MTEEDTGLCLGQRKSDFGNHLHVFLKLKGDHSSAFMAVYSVGA